MISKAAVVWMGIACVGLGSIQAAQQPSPPASSPESENRAVLNRYCVTCHNQKLKTAGLMLDKMDVANPPAGAEVWENVIRKLRAGAMPPPGLPRPDCTPFITHWRPILRLRLIAQRRLIQTPAGHPSIHRLNRAEYSNAIRDLLGVNIDGESPLPADDSGYGFDNVGAVLTVSPTLLERYLSAARKVSRLAVGDPDVRPSVETQEASKLLLQTDRMSELLPFGSRRRNELQPRFSSGR